jgi:hypothetical protein
LGPQSFFSGWWLAALSVLYVRREIGSVVMACARVSAVLVSLTMAGAVDRQSGAVQG